jgi:hypothetical protein
VNAFDSNMDLIKTAECTKPMVFTEDGFHLPLCQLNFSLYPYSSELNLNYYFNNIELNANINVLRYKCRFVIERTFQISKQSYSIHKSESRVRENCLKFFLLRGLIFFSYIRHEFGSFSFNIFNLSDLITLLPCASTICRAATVIIIASAKGEAQ